MSEKLTGAADMVEACPKCGGTPKCGWLYYILEVGEGIRVSTKLSLEQAHRFRDKTDKEFQGNLNASMREAIKLLIKHRGGTTKHYGGTKPPVRSATLGYECSKCDYQWKVYGRE